MDIFCVGGCVRDVLLGKTPKDIDYVVVGSTPQKMIMNGFKEVGRDFPVFLDPNGNEYALARTERKTGPGYRGFSTHFDPDVTLEDDVFRRDLTINSLAVDVNDWEEFKHSKNINLVIDSCNGLDDLENRILRHTSDAFSDDPVRILRIARFAARYFAEFCFEIAPETQKLMTKMVKNGEVDNLVPERIWLETEKALMETCPHVFFQILGSDVLEKTMPIFNNTECYENVVFFRSAVRNLSLKNRLMILTCSLDINLIEEELVKLTVPRNLINDCLKFNKMINILNNTIYHNYIDVFTILDSLNAWNCSEQLKNMGIAVAMFLNNEINENYDMLMVSLTYANVARFDMLSEELKSGLKGKEIGEAITELRLERLREVL